MGSTKKKKKDREASKEAAVDDGVDSAKMISESTLVAAFDEIQATAPNANS